MNNIIWVASYPKSGNTLMRYLLGNYFFNKSNKFDYNIINNIRKFHLSDDLINSNSVIEELRNNPLNISRFWIKSQKNIDIENGNVAFLKTHNSLVNINGNQLTNSSLSLAIIYIVRDPRDVAISYSKFRGLSIDETIKNMISKNLVYVKFKNNPCDVEIIGSWNFNYNSWKKGIPDIPRIIVKYEDLVDDCYSTFRKVIVFLSERLNIQVDESKIHSSVKFSDFTKLKNYETKYGFDENTSDGNFFNTGSYNNWKKILSNSQVENIEKNLFIEMEELGYINKQH